MLCGPFRRVAALVLWVKGMLEFDEWNGESSRETSWSFISSRDIPLLAMECR